MPGVFDTKTKTGRKVADPITDDTLPNPAALSWGAITTPAAVAGTVGADCKLVHGDLWQQIEGKHTELIMQDFMTTINGSETQVVLVNQTITVTANQSLTVIGSSTVTRIGVHSTTNIAVYNSTCIAPRVEVHVGPETRTESTGWYKTTPFKGEVVYGMEQKNVAVKNEIAGAVTSVSGYKFDLSTAKTDVKGAKNEAKGFVTSADGLRASVAALKSAVRGVKARVSAVAAQVGARLGGPPTSLGGN